MGRPIPRWSAIVLGAAAIIGCDASTGSGGAGGAPVTVDPFCATRPKLTFCEDFDAAPLPGAFAQQVVVGDATLTRDDETAASPTFGLRVITKGSDAAPATGVVQHAFAAGERLRLFAQVFVPADAPLTGEVEIGAFTLAPSGYRVGFLAAADGTLSAFEEDAGMPQVRTPGQGTLPRGAWVSVRWDVNLHADGTGTALLRIGNDTILQTDAITPPAMADELPTAVLGLGRATGAWDVRFDNVTVEIEG